MLTIKILGTGCPNCQKVEANTKQALTTLQPEGGYELLKVTDPIDISSYVLRTPGLVINEQVKAQGRIPSPDEIAAWLSEAQVAD